MASGSKVSLATFVEGMGCKKGCRSRLSTTSHCGILIASGVSLPCRDLYKAVLVQSVALFMVGVCGKLKPIKLPCAIHCVVSPPCLSCFSCRPLCIICPCRRVNDALVALEHCTHLTAIIRACIALGETWGWRWGGDRAGFSLYRGVARER